MRLTKKDHEELRARSQSKAAFAATHGWAVGDLAEAAHDITTGLFQAGVIAAKGTLLKIIGLSGNGLHPIAVAKANAEHCTFAVSASNLRRPNEKLRHGGENQ